MKIKPFSKTDDFITSFSSSIPWSYYGIIKSELDSRGKTILDIGCGNGTFMYVFNKDKKFKVTGVDIFAKDLKSAKKLGIYKKLIKSDIMKLRLPKRSFDVVIASHVIEHLSKKQGVKLLEKLEKIAGKKVIIVTPLGFRKQEGHGGNIFQEHKSGWHPRDFKKRGYRVIGQGLGVYYTNEKLNKFLRAIGPLNNLIFILHVLAQPFLSRKFIKFAHQIICIKEIEN